MEEIIIQESKPDVDGNTIKIKIEVSKDIKEEFEKNPRELRKYIEDKKDLTK